RAINNILIEFNPINKTLTFTTNNKSAMLVYDAYILNLAACHELEIVDQDIVNIRMLMLKIKGLIVLCDELKELYKMQKLDYLKLELDI
ncbi:2868_t:CDS:2, partial [Scutellospora calospora]